MIAKITNLFLSLKFTVILLALSMVLVLAGTLAQVDQGIWTVMDQYFRCYIAHIDIHVFFPRNWSIPDITLLFPGGFMIGWLLTINLIAVHAKTFRITAIGSRKIAGIAVFGLGIFVIIGVMLGWGTASVAITEDDAFWRVFLRLGRGTLAAIILYVAAILLYQKRAGMVLLHAGILFLLIGEFFTALFAVEATMTIKQGQTANFLDHSQQLELSFTETSNPEHDTVTVIPQHFLKAGKTLAPEALPFKIKIHQYIVNSTRPQPLEVIPEAMKRNYPAYTGLGAQFYVAEQREANGASGGRNAQAVDIELLDPQTGSSLGRYVLSLWFYPNFVQQSWDQPTFITVGDKTYKSYLRFKREYAQTSNGDAYSIKLLEFVHEKYEGTQTPKDFASRIQLINTSAGVDRELRIWMNNPLRYARRTFYQSGYLPDNSGTILQVVKNDTWMVPYLACMIVFIGMTAQFIQSIIRYTRRAA